jgi:hypothetical protein
MEQINSVYQMLESKKGVLASCDVYYIKGDLISLGQCEASSGMGHEPLGNL